MHTLQSYDYVNPASHYTSDTRPRTAEWPGAAARQTDNQQWLR